MFQGNLSSPGAGILFTVSPAPRTVPGTWYSIGQTLSLSGKKQYPWLNLSSVLTNLYKVITLRKQLQRTEVASALAHLSGYKAVCAVDESRSSDSELFREVVLKGSISEKKTHYLERSVVEDTLAELRNNHSSTHAGD